MDELLRKQYEVRKHLLSALERDLIGPGSEFEIINEDPISRYISGVLYPQVDAQIDAELDIDTAETDSEPENGYSDPPIALANVRYPASFGISFAVDANATECLEVEISAGRFELVNESRGAVLDDEGAIGTMREWKRVPIGPIRITIPLKKQSVAWDEKLCEGLKLFIRERAPDNSGVSAITLVLLNSHKLLPNTHPRDARAFFQVSLTVTGTIPDIGIFVPRPSDSVRVGDPDLESNALLYRNVHEFAVGHGCSVDWAFEAERVDRAIRIKSTFLPRVQVPISVSNPEIRGIALGMRFLAFGERDDVVGALRSFCSGYLAWITETSAKAQNLAGEFGKIAVQHMDNCREAHDRIAGGVAAIESRTTVWTAFQLANRAMLQQRARTEWLKGGKATPDPIEDPSLRWRPFQLAFILQCLDGISEPNSEDRDLADLLWFPTGGGKTEAYLGLIAFTIFHRRLTNTNGGGVTALMRYTLRLLTLQQFQRASLLICCCEELRRNDPRLGTEQISIGLWVGEASTPNNLDNTRLALDALQAGRIPSTGNPVQLYTCPWCDHLLSRANYTISTNPRRLNIACGQTGCAFRTGLPVYVVDEDVYAVRPSLVIATVDKYAAIAWNDSTSNLFNLGDPSRSDQPGPELIIQDELHLIAGPLGTLVGLYEAAIDMACSVGGRKPKVIASTATIRRAGQQTLALFDREVRQFPPSGIASGNSYFAVEAPQEQQGTRQYIGMMAPGTSQTTLLVRAYASLLQSAREQLDSGVDPKALDPYWTLLGYFNSLRVLGGAYLQVHDDVHDRLALLATQNNTSTRGLDNVFELTSRIPSSDVPKYLSQMAETLESKDVADIILATNMISVGVDIDRLGLMVVMGQPQATSEYIQSTSRVGRRYPGLVGVLFNSAKSRDRSHYEAFRSYHEAFYRRVESASVTPFSARARDRGLHAVLIAGARLTIPALRPNAAAANIADHKEAIQSLATAIVARVRAVDNREADSTAEDLNAVILSWINRAKADPHLVYFKANDPEHSLLKEAGGSDSDSAPGFPTARSMRDVDQESYFYAI